MADNDEQAAPKKGKLKLIIIIVLGVLLVGGLAAGGTFWLLQSGKGDGDEANEAESFQPSQYYSITDPFIVTVTTGAPEDGSGPARRKSQHHMQIYAALQSRDESSLDAARTHAPLLKSRLRTLFGSQGFSEMQRLEGKQQLAEEATETVNAVLSSEGAPPIERVLFTNFVLQ